MGASQSTESPVQAVESVQETIQESVQTESPVKEHQDAPMDWFWPLM